MAEPIKFTELTNAGVLNLSAIMAIVQAQGGELVSLQCSMAQVAELVAQGAEYNELTTEQKRLVDAINELNRKIKDLELFKFPNVTIVGTPTISQGQISDFSANDFLLFPFLVDFKNQSFEINMAFTTGANVTSQENILDSDYGLAFAIREGRFVVAISTNGTSWDLGEGVGSHVVQPYTNYFVRLSWNKNNYELEYSLDGEEYISDITKEGTAQPFPRQIYIGVGENAASIMNHFTGIVNLNDATLRINGEVIWQGMDDAGLSTRLDTSLSNVDSAGVDKIRQIAGGGGGGGAYFFTAGEATAAQVREQYRAGKMCFLVDNDLSVYPLTAVDAEYIQDALIEGVFFAKAFGYGDYINVTLKWIPDDAGTTVSSRNFQGVSNSRITNDMSETSGKIPTDTAVRSYVTKYLSGRLEAKADTSLENINEAGEQKIRDIAGGGGGGGGSVVDITPILTADSDQVITNAPTFYNGKFKWFVFKSDVNDYAYPDEVPSPKLAYIGYDFLEPQSVVAVKVRYIPESNNITNLKVIASNDGEAWEDLTPVENIGGGNTNYWYTFLFGAPKTYRMFAVQFGEYRNYAKLGAIRFMGMKTPPVDVQINGTSIVDSNNVANIPFANPLKTVGMIMPSDVFTVNPTTGLMTVNPTATASIDNRYGNFPLTCSKIDYALKQAMSDGKGAAWTDTEKANARARMGAASAISFVDVNVPSKMYVSVAAAAGVPINGVLNVLGLGTEDIAQASIVDARPASFTLCITVGSPMNVRIYYY